LDLDNSVSLSSVPGFGMVSSSSPALGRRKEFVLCIAIEIEERCGVVRRGNARGLQAVRVEG
jgi:hypothetical protein